MSAPGAASTAAEPLVRLGEGETALFAYGSLLLRSSLERTLGHPYDGPLLECALDGWRRSWNVAMPNATMLAEHEGRRFTPRRVAYLNIRPEPGTRLVGMLFVVTSDELDAFDRREWIYRREDVTAALRGVRVEGGAAFAYVGLPQYEWSGTRDPREIAVRETYVRMVADALQGRDAAFRAAYERTTDEPPPHLVVRDLGTAPPPPRVRSAGDSS